MARAGVTSIDLEFDTGSKGSALLGDIASSLVSLDELLRDLASIAAYPDSVEFRKIEIVSIELRSPLKIKLSLFAIPPNAVKAFESICRDIIRFREQRSRQAPPAALVQRTLEGVDARITEQEAQRLSSHIVTLQNAEIPLKRIEVKEE
jgi:hypothetical protein